jgi:hypothetical protein
VGGPVLGGPVLGRGELVLPFVGGTVLGRQRLGGQVVGVRELVGAILDRDLGLMAAVPVRPPDWGKRD